MQPTGNIIRWKVYGGNKYLFKEQEEIEYFKIVCFSMMVINCDLLSPGRKEWQNKQFWFGQILVWSPLLRSKSVHHVIASLVTALCFGTLWVQDGYPQTKNTARLLTLSWWPGGQSSRKRKTFNWLLSIVRQFSMLCLVFFKAEIIEIYKMLNTIVRQGLKRKLKVSGIFTKGLFFFFMKPCLLWRVKHVNRHFYKSRP